MELCKNEVQNILKRYVYIHKNVISIYHYLSVKWKHGQTSWLSLSTCQ